MHHRVTLLSNYESGHLWDMFSRSLSNDADEALSQVFHLTLQRISASKAYRIAAYRESGYKQIKRHLQWCGYSNDSSKVMAERLNQASSVFDHFEKIVNNILSCSNLDIRRFNLHQLYLAKNISWCMMENANYCKGKMENLPDPPPYNAEQFQEWLEVIRKTDMFSSLRGNPAQLTALFVRTQRILVHE